MTLSKGEIAMKYRVENLLDIFEFHDSDFTLVHFGGEELIVSVKHLIFIKTPSKILRNTIWKLSVQELLLTVFMYLLINRGEHGKRMLTVTSILMNLLLFLRGKKPRKELERNCNIRLLCMILTRKMIIGILLMPLELNHFS